MLADIVFTMSDRFTLTRTCAAVHDRFFGQNAEGLVFTTLLPRAERTRFIKTIDSVRSARRTDSATVAWGPLHDAQRANLRRGRVSSVCEHITCLWGMVRR